MGFTGAFVNERIPTALDRGRSSHTFIMAAVEARAGPPGLDGFQSSLAVATFP